jgi:hypothetical protein
MVGSFVGCCARAASGQAAAPPSSVMNSRRFMSSSGLPPPAALCRGRWGSQPSADGRLQSVCRTLSLPEKGRQVLGADLNCSESRAWAAGP